MYLVWLWLWFYLFFIHVINPSIHIIKGYFIGICLTIWLSSWQHCNPEWHGQMYHVNPQETHHTRHNTTLPCACCLDYSLCITISITRCVIDNSNHQQFNYFCNNLIRWTIAISPKLYNTGYCKVNPLVICGFLPQRSSDTETIFMPQYLHGRIYVPQETDPKITKLTQNCMCIFQWI